MLIIRSIPTHSIYLESFISGAAVWESEWFPLQLSFKGILNVESIKKLVNHANEFPCLPCVFFIYELQC